MPKVVETSKLPFLKIIKFAVRLVTFEQFVDVYGYRLIAAARDDALGTLRTIRLRNECPLLGKGGIGRHRR